MEQQPATGVPERHATTHGADLGLMHSRSKQQAADAIDADPGLRIKTEDVPAKPDRQQPLCVCDVPLIEIQRPRQVDVSRRL